MKLHVEKTVPSATPSVINKCHFRGLISEFLDFSFAGSGEVDLDALLEDLCVMEKDMNSGSESESILSESFVNPNSPLSPKVKVRNFPSVSCFA